MRPGVGAKLRRDAIVLAVVVVIYLLIASQVQNSYYQLMLTLVPIWAVLGHQGLVCPGQKSKKVSIRAHWHAYIDMISAERCRY